MSSLLEAGSLFAAACDIAADPETSRASAVSTSLLTVGTLRFQRCTQSPVSVHMGSKDPNSGLYLCNKCFTHWAISSVWP